VAGSARFASGGAPPTTLGVGCFILAGGDPLRHLEPSWVAYPLPFKRVGRSSLSFAADFNSSDPSAVVLLRDNSHTNCSMANPGM
jgi:hypothetical protein